MKLRLVSVRLMLVGSASDVRHRNTTSAKRPKKARSVKLNLIRMRLGLVWNDSAAVRHKSAARVRLMPLRLMLLGVQLRYGGAAAGTAFV